ncbi:MAG: ribonuclease Y [Bdellovibrionales bacterium]|nr:ribonuclease Y [Bdellovibrionales bacterium]
MEIIFLVVGFVVGAGLFAAYRFMVDNKKKKGAQMEANRILNKARSELARLEKEGKDKAQELEMKMRKNLEQEARRQKEQARNLEQSLENKNKELERENKRRQEDYERKMLEIKEKSERLKTQETRLDSLKEETQQKLTQLTQKLESVATISKDAAKEELRSSLKQEVEAEAAKMVMTVEEDAKQQAEAKAKRIIGMAISRFAGEFAAERTISIIPLPDQELKGKIIGKEGRNIRAIESLCGVDLILDENPEAVVISGFDPVRREVARRSMETLITDGRIHPGRIEEVVDKTKKELFKSIKMDGEKACLDLGLNGINMEIHKTLGSLKYRTSYTQNNYGHSIEVGMLAGLMAAEMGADVKMARRAGLFHDLGKAMDHSIEGSHAVIGADFAKRYGEPEVVCHAIRAHHEDEKPRTLLAYLVQAADALSSARPGARKSMAENYIQRLEDLESIANSFEGVERTFAIQAGREIRVIVDSSRVTDEQSLMLSRDIARKVEREMKYPGQIKISVVRETRAVEHAR